MKTFAHNVAPSAIASIDQRRAVLIEAADIPPWLQMSHDEESLSQYMR